MKDKAQAEQKFKADIFATETAGIVIEDARPGYARCRMDITPAHLNAGGVAMGGAIFTLADFTSAIATNNLEEPTVTLSSSIEYLSPGKGAYLIAEGRMLKEGRICFFEVTVTSDAGKTVAKVTGHGYRMQAK